jgi:hypothetical protein
MKRLFFVFPAVLLLAATIACGSKSGPNSADQSATTTTAQNSSDALPFGKAAAKDEKGAGLVAGEKSLVPNAIKVPAGTPVSIRLAQAVSSASSNAGDRFDATLDEPLVINDQTVAPKGAAAVGRVVQAKSSGRLHDSGYIRVTLASVEINGKQVPVQASSIFVKGANHNKRNLAMIGGGAGAGALIGGLTGGGKGALIGSAVGAGAGTTGAYATGKKDVGFGPERKLTFRLLQPLEV